MFFSFMIICNIVPILFPILSQCLCISSVPPALEGGKKLGVEPVLVASDMSKRDVEYLGPMAYIANYQWIAPKEPASEALRVKCDLDNVRVNNPVSTPLNLLCFHNRFAYCEEHREPLLFPESKDHVFYIYLIDILGS